MYNESNEGSSFNLLAVSLFLLQDYYENGSYRNTEDIIESNGSGDILWDKTINETFSIIFNKRPYYIDLQTRKRVFDEFDFFIDDQFRSVSLCNFETFKNPCHQDN